MLSCLSSDLRVHVYQSSYKSISISEMHLTCRHIGEWIMMSLLHCVWASGPYLTNDTYHSTVQAPNAEIMFKNTLPLAPSQIHHKVLYYTSPRQSQIYLFLLNSTPSLRVTPWFLMFVLVHCPSVFYRVASVFMIMATLIRVLSIHPPLTHNT